MVALPVFARIFSLARCSDSATIINSFSGRLSRRLAFFCRPIRDLVAAALPPTTG
jgi:hypothetical protein